jgi:hypothetical protein
MTGRAGRSRRAVLGGLAALAGLAGCTNRGSDGGPGGDGTSDGDPDPGGPFAAVRVEGTTLVVELAEDASVDGVNVIAPSGSVFAEQRVATGATRVEVALDTTYQPGEHRIVAVRDGESVAETTLAIESALEILGVGVGANNPDRMPDGMGNTAPSEAFVEVTNTGNGPATIEKLLFLDGVPNPTQELESVDESNEVSGIFDTETGAGELDFVRISSGESLTLYSNTLPFLIQSGDSEIDCSSGSQSADFRVVVVTRATDRASRTFGVDYSPSSGDRPCAISIREVN